MLEIEQVVKKAEQYLKDHPIPEVERLTGRERLVLRLRLGYESGQAEG